MTTHTDHTKSAQSPPPPIRKPNKDSRPREYLRTEEVDSLVTTGCANRRHSDRDSLIIRMLFAHALRVSELCQLEWDNVDLKRGTLTVNRVKGGTPSTQYLDRFEINGLKGLRKADEYSRWVFTTERNQQFSPRGIHKIVAEAGQAAHFEFSIHPHMLRHSKGYQLANKGTDTRLIQGYLGHRNIQHTCLYTELDPRRFKGLER